MDQTVNIPFSHKLDPGDSEFTIEVLSRFRDNPNRLFGFSSVTLCPDYFSKKAYKLDMDSEKELKAVVKNDFHLEVDYDKDVFNEKPWTNLATNTNIGDVLKSINTHYEKYKPRGCVFPAVVFDWFDIMSLGKNVDSDKFHQAKAIEYYGEEYSVAKHDNWLPSVYRDKTRLNNMAFPTKPEAMSSIRIRMTTSQNITVAFSNVELLQIIGLADNQTPAKVKNQFQFKNASSSLVPTVFLNEPKFDKLSFTTKIHIYPSTLFVVSNLGVLKTTVENERKPEVMAREYSNAFKTTAFSMNLELSLEHVASEKKLKVIFPQSTGIRMSIRVPPYVGHRLGYGHVDNIKYNMTSAPYPVDDVTGDLLSRAQVLVYDAGMVVVSLDERGSQQTHQFSNTFMAVLEAHESGVLTTKQGVEMPRVPVSQFNKDMRFVLSRFNENNEPIPLGWKDGAYIRGVLVGKV